MNPQLAAKLSQLHQQDLLEAARHARAASQARPGTGHARRFRFTLRVPRTAVVTAQVKPA
jgi:hypothetical protein